jgi:hypothetical protein
MVRAFKNTRNVMIEKGALPEVMVPSYFLEWMLYNVPNEKFTGSYTSMLVEYFNRAASADKTKLTCANRLHWLSRDGTPTSWLVANFDAFTAAAKKFWES